MIDALDSLARALISRGPSEKASIEPQKAVTGPGAAVMSWGTPISQATNNAQQMMREAQTVYARGNRWVKKAEMVISGRVGSVAWHLETDNGETIGDDSRPELKAIRDLFEKPIGAEEIARTYPGQPRTRRESWGLTSRHMGLCNVGFWFLDEIDAAIGWPKRIFMLRPDRMMPNEEGGRLVDWILDKDNDGGTHLSLEQVLPFYLDPVDKGHFGTGLVESILSTLPLPNAIDRHAIDTLDSGGRLPGIYSPKESGTGNDVFDRMVTDLRTIREMPDSSKRDVVARAPLEFTPTSADMGSLVVHLLAGMSRDDVLAHWGVPLSTIGGYTPAGMNSGETRKYDEAALWQNAVQFRIDALYETIQFRLLDRLKAIGINVQLVIDTPEFDDDSPKYELAERAQGLPLRNVERRALLGLDPFGEPSLDNAIWMPVSVVELAQAPSDAETRQAEAAERQVTKEQADALGALIRSGFDPADALRALGLPDIKHVGLLPITLQAEPAAAQIVSDALGKAKLNLEPVRNASASRIKKDVAKLLSSMGKDIAARVRDKGDQITRKPGSTDVWMPSSKRKEWEQALARVLNPHLSLAAETVGQKVEAQLGKSGKADPLGSAVLGRLMKSVGKRIGGILDTTRDDVKRIIEQGVRDGVGAAELGDRIEAASVFNEYRAELIARTETAHVLNEAALESYREFGVGKVRAIDGDDDEECRERDGQEFDLDEALEISDHPNGTLDWVPVL